MIYNCPMVLALDNAPVHSNIKRIFLGNEFKINKILRLWPYSPILNPIECHECKCQEEPKREY